MDARTESPSDVLASAGRAAYGADRWRVAFAKALGISDETIRRWLTDRKDNLLPDHGVFDDALALLHKRAKEIDAAAEKLERWIMAKRKKGAAS